MLISLVSFLIILGIGYAINSIIRPKKFPPGPKWYPFVGCSNAVYNAAKTHGSQFKGLLELSKEYSTQVLGLKLGNELLVVVFGSKFVRQLLTESVFEGRPNTFFLRLRCLGKKTGITFTDGLLWKIHRQFTVTQLKHVGFGKTLMENEIHTELQGMINYLNENSNKPIAPNNFVSQAVMNVLWKFVAGEKIKKEKWDLMEELFRKRSKAFSVAGGLLNQIPWCRFLIPGLSGYTLITDLNRQISEIIEEAIEKHKNNEIDGKDFIYSFLQEMDLNKETFTEEQLKVVCLDLLIAGAQTTSNLLEFSLIQVILNDHIQDKIHKEIDSVLGGNVPCWNDQSKLTYLSAFLLEVQRHYPIAPQGGPRRVLEDTYIDGYLIPKDTTILPSLGDLHFDPDIWEEPHAFKPERFIDDNGEIINLENLFTFGLGRRRCPGDALAKSFILIAFAGILQKFKIEAMDGNPPPREPVIGLIASPKPYKACFIPRQVK